MTNILTLDLEDWYQLAHRRVTGASRTAERVIFHQLDSFCALLEPTNTKATFFVLGMVAEQFPQLVRQLAERGHEVACHGYAHLLVHRLTPAQFREDTLRAKKLLEDLSGDEVCGYRAAEFSIVRESLWALDALADCGFRYDSSIFPVHHRRYGIPKFDSRPQRYELSSGRSIVELPLSTFPVRRAKLPVAGGGYFRLLPLPALSRAVARVNACGLPFITYFHPYEFDNERLDTFRTVRPAGLKQRVRGALLNFHQNLGRCTMTPKLAHLLRTHRFSTCREYLDANGLGPGRALLSAHGH